MFSSTKILLPMMLAGVLVAVSASGSHAARILIDKPTVRTGDGAAPRIRLAQRHERRAMATRAPRSRNAGRASRPRNAARASRGNARPFVNRGRPNVRRHSPTINRPAFARRRAVVQNRRGIERRRGIRRPPIVQHRIKRHKPRIFKRHRPRIHYYPRDYRRYDYRRYSSSPYYYYAKLSCSRVKSMLRNDGYRRIRAFDCNGSEYGFHARLGKRRYEVTVDAYTGEIIDESRA